MFNLAKGVLVVDPIEVQGVHPKHRHSNIYILMQLGTIVHRTKCIPTGQSICKWQEDSQCQFDISPREETPVLKLYLMEDIKPVPLVVDECQLPLIPVFHSHYSEGWVKFDRLGQLNIELTFYDLAPLIPRKGWPAREKEQEPLIDMESAGLPDRVQKDTQDIAKTDGKASSAADQVFEDTKEERHRFRRILKGVKRRYKARDYHHFEGSRHASISSKATSQSQLYNPLAAEVLMTEKQGRSNSTGSMISTNSDLLMTSTGISNHSSQTVLTEQSTDSELDLQMLPFSADEIGGDDYQRKLQGERILHQQKVAQNHKASYRRLTPEEYALAVRLEKGLIRPEDFQVEPGASEYNGDGTWGKGCLRDSYRITGGPPQVPPRIPIGMRNEEYYIINRNSLQTI